MPQTNFGDTLSFSASKFTKLKKAKDSIRFRLIDAPFYDGKHFLVDKEGNWDIKPCPRINKKEPCELCTMFFKALASAKKEGLDKKATQKLTRPWKASISFYYPIINRETSKFEIFQTTSGVRTQIEAELELGTKILKRDLIVVRTEKPGSYYKLSVVDSSETKPLTKEEQEEFKKGKETDLSEYIMGTQDSGKLADEAADNLTSDDKKTSNDETISNDEEINF